jgi:hypothetical protein
MNKIILERGKVEFPHNVKFQPANNLNRAIYIETINIDIDLVASFRWGPEGCNLADSIPLLDPNTGDSILLALPKTDDHHGIMLRDFGAPTLFVTITAEAGPSEAVSSLEQSGNVDQLNAQVQFSVDPKLSDTVVSVEYGPTDEYGSSVNAPAVLQGDAGVQALLLALANLTPGITYHWRVKMANSVGISYGADKTFQTLGVALPGIDDIVTTPAANTCHIALNIHPGGANTDVVLQYGTTAQYGQGSVLPDVPAGVAEVPCEVDLAGLLPATTYHYRFVATNSAGVEEGVDGTFITLAQ